jgi:hypothetical protein
MRSARLLSAHAINAFRARRVEYWGPTSMLERIKQLLGFGGSFASHPGRVQASRWRVARSYPLWPTLLGFFWIASLLAVVDGFDWEAIALFAIVSLVNYAYWASIRSWFWRGDVCPAVIVSEKPLLVATLADLTAGEDSYPAVKIRREPALRFPGTAGRAGKTVACIARYDGSPGDRCWTNFHPRPVLCATAEEAESKRLIAEISRERWKELQAAIQRLPRPFRPGLYRLTGDPG